MGTNKLAGFFSLLCGLIFLAVQGVAGEIAKNQENNTSGMLEIECNISRVDLHLCPRGNYKTEEKSVLFGLVKSERHFCSGGEIFLGETPIKPVGVPEGKYILLVPSKYHLAREGPVEIGIESGKRTFFPLKLFSPRADGSGEDYGSAGSAGGTPSR